MTDLLIHLVPIIGLIIAIDGALIAFSKKYLHNRRRFWGMKENEVTEKNEVNDAVDLGRGLTELGLGVIIIVLYLSFIGII